MRIGRYRELNNLLIMHQSIAAGPTPPPPGNRGAFAHVVCPRGGTFAILLRPGGWAFANPGATPGHLTHVFESAMDEFSGKDDVFVEQWLVRQGLEKICRCSVKGMFSQFWIFLHSLEIFNVKNKI